MYITTISFIFHNPDGGCVWFLLHSLFCWFYSSGCLEHSSVLNDCLCHSFKRRQKNTSVLFHDQSEFTASQQDWRTWSKRWASLPCRNLIYSLPAWLYTTICYILYSTVADCVTLLYSAFFYMERGAWSWMCQIAARGMLASYSLPYKYNKYIFIYLDFVVVCFVFITFQCKWLLEDVIVTYLLYYYFSLQHTSSDPSLSSKQVDILKYIHFQTDVQIYKLKNVDMNM